VVTGRPSLVDPDLAAVWNLVRRRLEQRGTESRGQLRLPELTSRARLTIQSLLGRPLGKTVDLARLERSLIALGIGTDLAGALAELGHPVSDASATRRADLATARAARAAARDQVATWPEEWAPVWIDEVIRTGVLRGMDEDAAANLVRQVRSVLHRLEATGSLGAQVGRVELAAKVLGSAHALDTGTRLEAATTRALAHRLGPAAGRDLWEEAGAHLDLTSGPVLTWRLPLAGEGGLASVAREATAAGIPLHLTRFALRTHPVEVPSGVPVLVVENPHLVEVAAQSDMATAVVASNGNPSGAVRLLLAQLLGCGATLRYHGDFDVAGLAMCGRMMAIGALPWRMDTANYLDALERADSYGVELPIDVAEAGPTPWEPELRSTFNRERRIVHEESLLPDLLQEPIEP
jgi:uncharacterized protein (TIGR02679 family)